MKQKDEKKVKVQNERLNEDKENRKIKLRKTEKLVQESKNSSDRRKVNRRTLFLKTQID